VIPDESSAGHVTAGKDHGAHDGGNRHEQHGG
jgi:hypothetical protein